MNDFFIGIELTAHCDLRCTHCLRAGRDGPEELPLAVMDKILREAESYGRPRIALTGGEPTLHSRFREILDLIISRGYTFHYVTNGFDYERTFRRIFPLLDHRQFVGISVSLDGSTEATHDKIRGRGSFRNALGACAVACSHGKELVIQMVVHRGNRHELEDVAFLASRIGASRLHFGHMQPTPRAVSEGLLPSPAEHLDTERRIHRLAGLFAMPVVLSAGFYDETPLSHCRFLKLGALHIDHRGRLTACCQLTNLEAGGDQEVVADLNDMPLTEAHSLLLRRYNALFERRLKSMESGRTCDLDHFHCWSCLAEFGKLEWMRDFPRNEWVLEHPYFKDKETP